jgi:hypothetical protein
MSPMTLWRADFVVIAGLALAGVAALWHMAQVPPDPRCFQIGDVTILVPDDALVTTPATPGAVRLASRCAPARKAAELGLRLRTVVADLPDWVEDHAQVTLRADHERQQIIRQLPTELCPQTAPGMTRGLQVRREFLSPTQVTDHITLLDPPGRGKCIDLDPGDRPGPPRTGRMGCYIEVALTETVTASFRLDSPAGYFGASVNPAALPDHAAVAEAVAVGTDAIRGMVRSGTGDWARLAPLVPQSICPAPARGNGMGG